MNTVVDKNFHESNTDLACLDLLAGAGASGSFPEWRLKHIIYVECTYAVTE